MKIGKYLVKLWARVRCLVFLTHSVYSGLWATFAFLITVRQSTFTATPLSSASPPDPPLSSLSLQLPTIPLCQPAGQTEKARPANDGLENDGQIRKESRGVWKTQDWKSTDRVSAISVCPPFSSPAFPRPVIFSSYIFISPAQRLPVGGVEKQEQCTRGPGQAGCV